MKNMKIETILIKRLIGVKVGNVIIGLMAFPWLHIFGNQPLHSASFWTWLICPPKIFFEFEGTKTCQFRFMWFCIEIVGQKIATKPCDSM